MSKLQPMYCRRCQQTLVTTSLDRCDACGSTDVVAADSRERVAVTPEAAALARLVVEKKAEPPRQYSAGVFGAIHQIVDTANTAPNVDPDDPEARRLARYHYRIVIVGCVFATLGVILGLVTAALVVADAKPHAGRLLLAPVMYGAGGFVFGMALMCLFAPTAFLTGPGGQPWMRMIGTRSPVGARIACAIFGLMVTAPLVAIGILIARS